MDRPSQPRLRFLHSDDSLSPVKLAQLRRISTEDLKASLTPDQRDSLKVRSDGTVLDGHHRLRVLMERGEDVNLLPREIMERES
jgi:hypothetical protein